MKRNNSSRPKRVDDSQQPVRKSKPVRPVTDGAKPRRTSFSKAEGEEGKRGFSKKPRAFRSSTENNLGERPAFKRRGAASDEAKPPRRKDTYARKSTSEEKPFERERDYKGKGFAAKRTTFRKTTDSRDNNSRDTNGAERKPKSFAAKTNKPFKAFRKEGAAEEGNERKPGRLSRSFSKEYSAEKPKSFKRTATEERPQKRTERAGYYTDKKKAAPARDTKLVPEYNLKRYEDKKQSKTADREKEETIRLNRYISNSGICSRREADTLIESGEIKVNGKVVTEMGYQVGKNDIVKYGNRVLNKEKLVYVLLNKPKGYITTTDDPEERKTVMDLVANACEQRIYPVGRLDRNTSGLLLFTNDGELADKLAHPSNDIKKVYQVELNKPITKDDFQKVADGVQLEDGLATVDDLAIISPEKTLLGLEIHIGRNRIVRRIFEHLGYEVTKLDRVSYAGLTKKDLPRGNWRFLTEKEVIKLKYFV